MGMRLTLVAVDTNRLSVLRSDNEELLKLLLHPPLDGALPMDKEWHGIHFLLTGDAWATESPRGAVIFGGEETALDLGYGPARILQPEQVHDIAAELRHLSIDELRACYSPAEMSKAGVYPDVWEREGLEALEWLLAGYANIRDFYAEASENQKAVLLAIV
jgi:hypothetical protein